MYASLCLVALAVLAAARPLNRTVSRQSSCDLTYNYICAWDTSGEPYGTFYGSFSDHLSNGGYTLNGEANLLTNCLNTGGPGYIEVWGDFADYSMIGAAAPGPADGGSADIGVGSSNWLVLTSAPSIPVGPPVPSDANNDLEGAGYDVAGVESAIWVTTWVPDVGTYQLTVEWVNSDGSTVPGYLVWWEAANWVIVTGDADAWLDAWSYAGAAYEATLWLC